MAGYRPKRTLYRLTFEDPDFEGLEVVTKRVSIGGLVEIAEMFDSAQDLGAAKGLRPEHLKLLRDLFGMFSRVLVSWNVEDDDGRPVPTTVDGLMSQEPDWVMSVIESWITGMVKAPPPLPSSSNSGGTSEEESTLALANASSSLRNSSGPS